MKTEKIRAKLKKEFSKILNELSREQLIGLKVLLNSYRSKLKWDYLSESAKASILRGKEDVKAGRYSDAFEFLENEG